MSQNLSEEGLRYLGEQLLLHTLSCAYSAIDRVYNYDCKNSKEGELSLHLLENSGLHLIVQTFNLSLNPDKLKELFLEKVEKIEKR